MKQYPKEFVKKQLKNLDDVFSMMRVRDKGIRKPTRFIKNALSYGFIEPAGFRSYGYARLRSYKKVV